MRTMRVEVPCTLMVTVEIPDDADDTVAVTEAQKITFDQFQSGLDMYEKFPVLQEQKHRASLYFEPLDPNEIDVEEEMN